jgi:hypothetical protein
LPPPGQRNAAAIPSIPTIATCSRKVLDRFDGHGASLSVNFGPSSNSVSTTSLRPNNEIPISPRTKRTVPATMSQCGYARNKAKAFGGFGFWWRWPGSLPYEPFCLQTLSVIRECLLCDLVLSHCLLGIDWAKCLTRIALGFCGRLCHFFAFSPSSTSRAALSSGLSEPGRSAHSAARLNLVRLCHPPLRRAH